MALAAAATSAAFDLGAPSFWTGALFGVAVCALIVGVLSSQRRRARVRAAADAAVPRERTVAATPVRRPLYLDRGLLNDLLAHAEPRDFGKGLRATLADDDLEGNAGDTRLLNKVIAGLRRNQHLIDLDLDPQAPLAQGRAVLLTARAAEHPMTTLAARAVSRVEAVVGGPSNGSGNGNGNGRGRTRRRSAPLVLELVDERSGRRYAGVVDTRRLRPEGRAWLASPVSVLAVVDEVLSSQDEIDARRVLAQVVDPVQVTADDADGAVVAGPGALVSVAALYR